MFIAISEDREILGIASNRPTLLNCICREKMFDNPTKQITIIGPNEYGFYNIILGAEGWPLDTFTIEEHDYMI